MRELTPNSAEAHNNLAWFLATCPEPKLLNPKRAVGLARKATELARKEGNFFSTLGVAHYRAGNCKAAIEALEKSGQLRNGGDAFDFFFLAMAHWQLGEKEKAREWYQKGIEWTEKNQKLLEQKNRWAEELHRFRAEAEELLKKESGVRNQESEKKKGSICLS